MAACSDTLNILLIIYPVTTKSNGHYLELCPNMMQVSIFAVILQKVKLDYLSRLPKAARSERKVQGIRN